MDDQTISPPPAESTRPPRPRAVRARSLPKPPPALWLVLGFLVVLLGFWVLRPSREGQDPASDPALALIGATPTPAQRPALQPITPVTHAQPPIPPADTGVVGHPQLTPPDEDEAATSHYTVLPGDTLGGIADRFGVTLEELMALNGLTNPNFLEVGQVLLLPSTVELAAPFQRLLPDSEVVLSPAYQDFDLRAFVREQGGYLNDYTEVVEGAERAGVEIVDLVSQRYSVGPRPLLAMLEYESGWVTQRDPTELSYPMGVRDPRRAGLFFQLSWAANRMNQGYYGKLTGRDVELRFSEGTRAIYASETNPGTTAIQNVFAVQGTPDTWAEALAEDGFFASYVALFGDPWARAIEPLIPPDLAQPTFALPWASGETWYFTGGPHGGWGDLSGWAALDFVPVDRTGCEPSSFWARAVAPGRVIRSQEGEVVVDQDGDGFVGTGWSVLYMHMASAGRAGLGSQVDPGDPIGRPSCEGGFSDAAHLHLARRYNGQWMEADGPVPFVLDGWQAQRTAKTYDGFLVRGDARREACACRQDGLNELTKP